MKKAFDQTFRDIKRGVNKKVLKVPGIEQKVLDATNNEPWGPHGSLLADIAHASHNYHEYQLTMGVLWKRLSDTGKNWRHVYKALTVLEYMVGHGSERAIDEIRERAYQISTLSDFQYIDSTGRDQGINVRRKSQSLVALVNDKERIAEVREKAASNKDKYYKPPGGYGDRFEYEGRYGSRDGERSSYGREYGYKDDDRNSRDGDRYSSYSRDSEDRYGRDGNRDEEVRGRSRSVDNYQYESRGRSSDRERSFEDDGQSQDGRGLERKFSEQNIRDAPPSYEEAVSESRSPVHSERDGGETPQAAVPGATSPPAESSVENKAADFVNESSHQQNEDFDEFDPRGSVSAGGATVDSTSALPTANNAEMDLLGSLADVFSPNPLANVSTDSTSAETTGQASASPVPSFSASQSSTQDLQQPFDDPFGDAPFKAITSSDTDPTVQQSFGATSTTNPDSGHMFGFGDSYSAVSNPNLDVQNVQSPSNSSFMPQEELNTEEDEIDILAGILPPSGQSDPAMAATQFPPNGNNYDGFQPQPASPAQNIQGQTGFTEAAQPYNMVSNLPGGMQFNNGGFMHQPGYAGSPNSRSPHYTPGLASHQTSASFPHQPGSATSSNSQTLPGAMQFNSGGGYMHQQGYADSSSSHSPHYPPGVASHQTSASFPHQPGSATSSDSQTLPGAMHFNNGGLMNQPGYPGSPSSQPPQYTPGVASHPTSESFPRQADSATSGNLQTPFSTPNGPAGQFNGGNFMTQQQVPGSPSHMLQRTQSEPVTTQGNYNNGVGDMFGPSSMTTSASQSALTPLTGAIKIVPPPQKKFEPKSTIWADTLSRGLVNFNISGPKTNPLADIGVDFAAMNRKEKRLEKPTATQQQQVTSTINMGKAMGSGTGLGRAGASAMRPPTNTMAGPNMGMNMNVGGYGGMNQNQPMGYGGMNQNQPMNMNMNMGMNAGGYGGMNQNQPMGMNQNQHMGMNQNQHMGMNQNQHMGMNQNQSMGISNMNMNMNMGGYGQGYTMQQQPGMVMPPGAQGMASGYNPMMGQGGYNPQQQPPYGDGYR